MTASNWTFVGFAYAAVWVAIGGYGWYLHRALQRSRAHYEKASAQAQGVSR